MAGSTILQHLTNDSLKSPKEAIAEALDHLPPEYLPDVLQFLQFLEYKYTANPDELSEDEALWEAVQAHQTYKAQHPDEEPECYSSGAEFLKAVADL